MIIDLLSYCSITKRDTRVTLADDGTLTIHDELGRVGYAHFVDGSPSAPPTPAQVRALAQVWCTPPLTESLRLGGPVCGWAFRGLTNGDVCGLGGSKKRIAVC